MAIRYFVDEDKKVVVCKMVPSRTDVWGDGADGPQAEAHSFLSDKLSKMFPYVSMTRLAGRMCWKHIAMEYMGKAKCSPEDTFNVEYGKKLARARMFEKYYAALSRAANEFEDIIMELDDMVTEMREMAEGLADKWFEIEGEVRDEAK